MLYYSNVRAQEHEKIQRLEDFFDNRPSVYDRKPDTPRELTGLEISILAELEALGFDDAQKPDFATDLVGSNLAESSEPQGVSTPSPDEALVYTTTPHPLPTLPQRLATVAAKLSTFKGTGKHARVSIPVRAKWERLSADERSAAIFHCAALTPGAHAFSLRFNDTRRERLALSDDPARNLSQRIGRLMRENLGRVLPFAFTFEFSSEKQVLHVHGIVIAEGVDLKAVRLILKQAAGVIHGPAGGTQLDLKALRDWKYRKYCLKDVPRTVELLGTEKIGFASEQMKAQAKAYNDQQRRFQKERRANCSRKRRTIR